MMYMKNLIAWLQMMELNFCPKWEIFHIYTSEVQAVTLHLAHPLHIQTGGFVKYCLLSLVLTPTQEKITLLCKADSKKAFSQNTILITKIFQKRELFN